MLIKMYAKLFKANSNSYWYFGKETKRNGTNEISYHKNPKSTNQFTLFYHIVSEMSLSTG